MTETAAEQSAMTPSIVAIVGPTGCGKTALSLELALQLGGEVVSCDSVQVYRGFDIGSAKVSVSDRMAVPHHMIDVVEAGQSFDAGTYAKAARAAIDDIRGRGRTPIVVGGTGLYLRALLGENFHGDLPKDETLRARLNKKTNEQLHNILRRLDPQRAEEVHAHDHYRLVRAVELRVLLGHPLCELEKRFDNQLRREAVLVIIEPDRDILRRAIADRVKAMLQAGLLKEAAELLSSGIEPQAKPMQSIGYKECVALLEGNLEPDHLYAQIFNATCQYAKRQSTWFRSVKPDLKLRSTQPARDVVQKIRMLLQTPRRVVFEGPTDSALDSETAI